MIERVRKRLLFVLPLFDLKSEQSLAKCPLHLPSSQPYVFLVYSEYFVHSLLYNVILCGQSFHERNTLWIYFSDFLTVVYSTAFI